MTDKQLLDQINDQQDGHTDKDKGRHHHHSKSGIIVKGMDDMAVRFSKCCSPVPGDEIVGFITRGRGVSIHRTDCVNIMTMTESERARMIEAEWKEDAGSESGGQYKTELSIYVQDQVGVLIKIAQVFAEREINVTSMTCRQAKNHMSTISVSFYIDGKQALDKIMEKLMALECVFDITRTTGQ